MRRLCCLVLVGCSALTDLSDLQSDDASTSDAMGDAGDVASPRVIRCGSTSCDPSSSDCCATCNEPDGASSCVYTYGCVDSGLACPLSKGDLDLGCSDPASCAPGLVCCDVLGNVDNEYFHYSSCTSLADCDASGPAVLLCDPNVPTCPAGTSCQKDTKRAPIQDIFVCE